MIQLLCPLTAPPQPDHPSGEADAVLALTGVGIAVIVAAAAAMYGFANSMNTATASVQSFNSTASATPPSATRSLTRTGEADLYRRGVE